METNDDPCGQPDPFGRDGFQYRDRNPVFVGFPEREIRFLAALLLLSFFIFVVLAVVCVFGFVFDKKSVDRNVSILAVCQTGTPVWIAGLPDCCDG
jgi:ABC-type dipeptide/oligopeptide/nickel transport system permease component